MTQYSLLISDLIPSETLYRTTETRGAGLGAGQQREAGAGQQQREAAGVPPGLSSYQ